MWGGQQDDYLASGSNSHQHAAQVTSTVHGSSTFPLRLFGGAASPPAPLASPPLDGSPQEPSPSTSGPSASTTTVSSSDRAKAHARRGLDRLSGLRELGFEVLSRKPRHERDKSSSSAKSLTAGGPKSPELAKTSPPYSRTNTAESGSQSPDRVGPIASTSTAHASMLGAQSTTTTDLMRRPPVAQNPSGGGGPSRGGARKGQSVLVTQDHESFSRVDIASLPNAAAIREKLYTKARVLDDDFQRCTVHLSSVDGLTEPGPALSDAELFAVCQQVLEGDMKASPLFLISLSEIKDYPETSPPYPSSPYTPGAGSAQNPATAETSSDSSLSGPRRRPHPRTSKNQTNSPTTSDSAHQSRQPSQPYPQTQPPQSSTSSSRRPVPQKDSSVLPPPSHPSNRRASFTPHTQYAPEQSSPHPAWNIDGDRRSSAGSVPGNERHLHPPTSEQQAQVLWERRSSAGGSDSGRPEWLADNHNQSRRARRQERQARSEMAAPTSSSGHRTHSWEYQHPTSESYAHPPPPLHPSVQSQRGGYSPAMGPSRSNAQMGSSGPIYRTAPSEEHAGRPRANSTSAQEAFAQSGAGSRSRPPQTNGNQGFLHFPQPIHHGQPGPPDLPPRSQPDHSQPYPPPNSAQYSQNLSPHPQGLRLNLARSMDNLRNMGPPPDAAPSGRSSVPPPLMLGSVGPHNQRTASPYLHPQPPIYEHEYDPRTGSLPLRSSASDIGGADRSHPGMSPEMGRRTRIPGPTTLPSDARRGGPIQGSPRLPVYPLANGGQRVVSDPNSGQRPYANGPDSLSPTNYPIARRPPASSQNSYPQPVYPHQPHSAMQHQHRRTSQDHLTRSAAMIQQASGPQRIPLHPGETLQEVMQARRADRAQASNGSPYPSQNPFDDQQAHQQHSRGQHSRAPTFEERYQRQQREDGVPQYTEGGFTASPPATYGEYSPYNPHMLGSPANSPPLAHAQAPSRPQQQPVQNGSKRSSSSSNNEPPHSPGSSRPSTASDRHATDHSVERPYSYSSNSTNEIPTPVSDREGQRRVPPPPPPHRNLSSGTGPASAGIKPSPVEAPRIVDTEAYDGIEMLREDTERMPAPPASKVDSEGRIRSPYLDALEAEDSEEIKAREAREWAEMFVSVDSDREPAKQEIADLSKRSHSTADEEIEEKEEDEDTLGKSGKAALLEQQKQHQLRSAEQEKAKKAGSAVQAESWDENTDTLGKSERKIAEGLAKASAAPARPASPAFSFVDDENDDAATWNVQMQPAKAPEPAPAKILSPVPEKRPASPAFSFVDDENDDAATWNVKMQPSPQATSAKQETPVKKAEVEQATPKERREPIPFVPAGEDIVRQDSPASSLKHEKPTLRVQTSLNASKAHGHVSSRTTSPKVNDQGRTPSPRSNPRKHRHKEDDSAQQLESSPSSHIPGSSQRRATLVSEQALSSGGPIRRASFKGDAWAFRPPVEQVYENLEEFFPGHDLDKPIIDAGISGPNSAISSPAFDHSSAHPPHSPSAHPKELGTGSHHPSSLQPGSAISQRDPAHMAAIPVISSSAVAGEASKRFNTHRKSMRMVAQDRKSRMKREERAARDAAGTSKDDSKLARRKSTKLWGRKIEEVTPAQAEALTSAKPDFATLSEKEELAPIKWVKGELIGKGTYGHVYLGFNVTNGEMIAVKQVELPRTASDKDDGRQLSVIEALKSEMELLKDLEHEKIVSYLGFDETPEHLSILLEYVPGGSIGRCLRKHGKFDEEVVQFFTTQILEGLEYLHQRGILHRDLKADNILVKLDGTIKISDFGISKRSSDIYNNDSAMSMQGSIFWMAPEVVHNERKGYSAKIDIWSLGCVVLEMFAGRRPWDSVEAIAAMIQLGSERKAPPTPKDVHLSGQAQHFLKECFQPNPEKRPQAGRLLCHKFLTLDKKWEFSSSKLNQAMVEFQVKQSSKQQAKYNKAISS